MHTNGRPNTTQNTKMKARLTPILIGRELVSWNNHDVIWLREIKIYGMIKVKIYETQMI